MIKHNFKKNYGQNFLKSTRFASLLVGPLKLTPEDIVLEVGPGDGMVTNLLLNTGAQVVAVEIDYDLLPNLIRRFADNPKFLLLHEDILTLDIQSVIKKLNPKGNFYVTGSLPYNISKKIIKQFIDYNISGVEEKVKAMSFIVQEEVAKNYVALPPKASFLSNYARVFTDVRKKESIPAIQFFPKPQVNGAIIVFTFKDSIENPLELVKFIKVGFSNPRKFLMKSLSNTKKWEKETLEAAFKNAEINENARAAELAPEQWVKLATSLQLSAVSSS
jgi:16S rRNA (adenine1518-N6/adenine1519-N6)-dimethyltransferase